MKNIIYLLAISIFMIGCSESKETVLQKIQDAENNLYAKEGAFQFNDSLATITIDAYEQYAESFPEDSLSAEYLFKAADLYRAKRKFEPALAIYDKIQNSYSEFKKVPQTVFLQGFVYENDLKDLPKAKERYEAFLTKYPDHDLAKDVKFSLAHLGKSPEEIIKEFSEKQEQIPATNSTEI